MSQRSDFLKYAKSLVGLKGGDTIRNWYNSNVGNIGKYNWPWCAAGISYCAAKTGIDSNIICPTASSTTMLNFFKNQGRFKTRGSYIPKGGDIIIFKWATSTTDASHVGLVDYVKDGYVHTVEFNSGSYDDGAVAMWRYLLTNQSIVGYGVPAFKKDKIKTKRKCYIRSNPWIDPQNASSVKLKVLQAGDKVKYIEDNGDGWAKVKQGKCEGFIQNKILKIKNVSLFPYAKISKAKTLVSVRDNLSKRFNAGKRVKVICTITDGDNKGKCIVRHNKTDYYVSANNLQSFTIRSK